MSLAECPSYVITCAGDDIDRNVLGAQSASAGVGGTGCLRVDLPATAAMPLAGGIDAQDENDQTYSTFPAK
jgi:hypothetical protein